MRRLVTALLPLALLAITPGCAPRRPVAPATAHPCAPKSGPAGARTPEDVDRLFTERVNAGDVDGVLALYEPEATLVRQDRSAATGTVAIREEIAELVAMRPQMSVNVFRVLMAGGDLAVVSDDWHLTGTGRDGKRIEVSGRASEVMRRQADGTWRIVVDDPDARAGACPPARKQPARRHGKTPKRR